MFLIFLCPESPAAMWIGTAVYGLFYRPTIGFCQDLNNKLTLPTEKSVAIVMVGLNYGASFVPYFTTVLWDLHGTGPIVLIIIVGSSMLVPLPLLYIARCVSFIHILILFILFVYFNLFTVTIYCVFKHLHSFAVSMTLHNIIV